ncbi:MAG TPA: phospholipase D-like domain-containing protein [Thermoanaerobaculia bacterium]|nr:phospholipase D-like domain-containing protein [Thermoanaerobaculia bacterium]
MTLSARRRVLAATVVLAAALQLRCTVTHSVLASEKREIYHFVPDFGVSDPQFRRSLDTLSSNMVGGNAARILKNGDQIFPAMTGDIRNAKVSVDLETYIFQPDDAGRQFAAAMIDAAKRGVEVRFLIDDYGSKLGDLEEPLKQAGVKVRVYRPIRLFSIYKIGKRTHRKLLIVDGDVGYTGGLGIDERWLGDARNTKEWRDTQVRVEGPVVPQMQAIFAEDWTYTTGEILAGDKFYPKVAPRGNIEVEAIKASRGDASSVPKELYYMAIQAARRSILIQNAYFLPDKQTRNALIRAKKRGVDVRVMVPGTNIDLPMVRLASRLHYGPLLDAGIQIYEYQPTMMHNKTFVVDGVFSTIGSINFDQRSMGKNAEESLAFYDRGFAAEVTAMFEDDWKRCRQVTRQKWEHRGLAARISEMIFWIWEPYY